MMGTSVTNWEQDKPNIWMRFVVSVVDVVLIAAAAAAAEIGSALV